MGYTPKRTLYQLTFNDPDLEGLEVATRALSIDAITALYELAEQVSGMDVANPDIRVLRQMADTFAMALVSWNVEEDDGNGGKTPVPATADGLCSQEIPFLLVIISAYTTAMTQAPPPLPGASSSGQPAPEAPIPALASSSRSLRNS